MADVPEGKLLPWRKSSFSSDTANCVEFARRAHCVEVRDSKDPHGPTLRFSAESWREFIAAVHEGAFDVPWFT